MEYQDYYKLLGVPRSANADDIKRAYRRLVRKYHPDVSTEPDADAKFKRMKEAYEVLKDPGRRAAFDGSSGDGRQARRFDAPPYWGSMFSFSTNGFSGAGALNDIFETFFDHAPRAGYADFSSFDQNDTQREGKDINVSIAITLEDSYRGATRAMTLESVEQDRYGYRFRRRRTIDVPIPKGITAGEQIRLENQGSPGVGRRSCAGDLYLHVEFEPHPVFELQGKDVYVILPVTPWEMALGRTVTTPTLGEPVDVRIPAGARNGQQLRLRGLGLPGRPPGDQFVELAVTVPRSTSARARALYESLEQVHSFNPRADLGV